MSLRRVPVDSDSVLMRPSSPISVAPAPPVGATISDQLGIANNGPARPFVRFTPQHPTPRAVGNVVDKAFRGYDAEPVYLHSSEYHEVDTAGMLGDALKMAKSKANAAVRKSKELAGKAAVAGKELAGKAADKAKAAAAAASERMSAGSDSDSEDEDGKTKAKAKAKAKASK
jgi:hypothetical protein